MKTPISQKLEDGFALPIAIGVGIIAILIATTMVIRSNQSQVASLSQRSTYKSLAVAETGVAKYLTFFNKHRELAAVDLPGTSATEWIALRDQIRTLPGCGSYADSQELLDNFGTAINIDGSDPAQGNYFLEDYTFSGTSGLLTVRGRASDQVEAGITNLEVSFPIDEVPLVSTEPGDFSDDCGDLATSIPVNTTDVLPFGNGQLINKVKAEVPYERISPADIVIFGDTDPDLANKVLPLSSSGAGEVHTYIVDIPSSGSTALDLGLDEFVQIADNQIVFLVTDDIDVNEGYFRIGNNSSLFIISSGKVTLRSSSSRPPLAMPPAGTISRFPFHVFLTGADPDLTTPGDPGELVIDVNERPFTIPIAVYAPFGSVVLNNSYPSVPDSFQGQVWAQRFSVTPDTDETFQTISGTLNTLTSDPASIPSFWRAALNVDNFTNTRIRSIDSWKKIDAP